MSMINKHFSIVQKFFIKSFIKHFILIMIPVMTIGPYVLGQFNKEVLQAAQANNQNLLYQINQQMDSLQQITDNAALYLSRNPSIAISLKNAFRTHSFSQSDIKSTQNVTIYLQNMVYTNIYLHSAYTYYDNSNNRFLTSDVGLIDTRRFYDCDWLESYRQSKRKIWFELRYLRPYAFADEDKVLTVYKKLYSPTAGNISDGVLVIQFHVKQILNYLDSLSLYPNQIIAFVDSTTGELLIQNKEEDLTDILYLLSEVPAGSHFYLKAVTHNGKSYVASLTESQRNNGWRYLSLVPYNELYSRSIAIRQLFLLLVCIAFLLSVILSFFSSKRDYSQLRSIFELLNQAGELAEPNHQIKIDNKRKDAYSYILNNLIRVFVEQDYLKVQISERKYKMQVLEMQALQQQINPHFLFNTLNTLYWESVRLTSAPNTCSQIISHLSDIMQYSLNKPQEQVTIQEEIDYLAHYIHIQTVRFGNRFEFVWDIDPQAVDSWLPKMTLQPLVENAIYHGIKECPQKGEIKLKVCFLKSFIAIHISDTGLGIPLERLNELRMLLGKEDEESSHIGLINTNRRLVLTYGVKSHIRLFSRYGHGTLMSFRIPLRDAKS